MYGDDLLVSPVLQPGVEVWSVYLPLGGSWVHLWSLEEYQGGVVVDIPASLGHTPVFYYTGSAWTNLFNQISLDHNKL